MFTEDLGVFFDAVNGFALNATLQGGAADAVQVILDREYLAQLGVAGTDPVALVQATQVAAGDIGKTLTIAAVVYTIRNRRPLDDGAVVALELQAP